jgi:peptidoglycan/LPS O-acetylase OafA/YrhL
MTHVFVGEKLFNAGSMLANLWHVDPFTHREINGHDFYFLGTRLWHGDIAYAVYLAMIIAMSYFTYRWIEKPAREWVRNRVQRRQQQAATSRSIVSA